MISAVGIKRILFADIDKVTADITPEIRKDFEFKPLSSER